MNPHKKNSQTKRNLFLAPIIETASVGEIELSDENIYFFFNLTFWGRLDQRSEWIVKQNWCYFRQLCKDGENNIKIETAPPGEIELSHERYSKIEDKEFSYYNRTVKP